MWALGMGLAPPINGSSVVHIGAAIKDIDRC